uniref:Protein Dr1 n=1 Tax=Caenorhabditis tropicalis TaxID=1561998 RepID=A0A1I7U3T6_9PELO
MDEDNEIGLPQKGINQIIKEVVPDMRIANESRDMINMCCVEFVKHIAREAQRIASQDQRKTIYHEHVQKALQNLGFTPDYLEAADSVLDACKVEAEKKLRRKNSRLEKCGIPEEKLYEMQQELIQKARQKELDDQLAHQQAQAAAVAAANSGYETGSSEILAPTRTDDDYDN